MVTFSISIGLPHKDTNLGVSGGKMIDVLLIWASGGHKRPG
jgi:hypothetical protein